MRRKNASNTGKEFEKALEELFKTYRHEGRADIEKVDPPVRMIGRKKILLKNPYLDYVGTIQPEGRMIQIEAKSTQKPTLPCGGKSGVTENQMKAMRRWQEAGAVVGVIWYCFDKQEARFLTLADLDMTLEFRKSAKWELGHEIPAMDEGLELDFLQLAVNLDALTKRNEKTP